MLIFFISSALCFALAHVLFAIDADNRSGSLTISFIYSRFHLSKTGRFLAICVFVVLIFVFLYYVSVLQIIKPTNGLYSPYDIVTGSLIDKIILGIIFGFMSATWIRRIYGKEGERKTRNLGSNSSSPTIKRSVKETRTDENGTTLEKVVDVYEREKRNDGPKGLTFVEKLEGCFLLVIFILGTTPLSIYDLLSGLTIDSPVAKFELRNQAQSNLYKEERAIDLDSLSNYHNGNGSGLEYPSGSFSPYYLFSVEQFVKNDLDYADAHKICPKDNTEASLIQTSTSIQGAQCAELNELRAVSVSIEPLTELFRCLVLGVEGAGTSSFLGNHVQMLIPFASRVHASSTPEAMTKAYDNFRAAALVAVLELLDYQLQIDDLEGSDNESGPCEPFRQRLDLQDRSVPDSFIPYDFKNWSASRPYLSIYYAMLLAVDNRYAESVGILDEWITNLKASSDKRETDTSDLEFWMEFRARAIQAAIFDSWARNDQRNFGNIPLEENINRLELYLNQFEKMEVISNRGDYSVRKRFDDIPRKTLLGISFERMPDSSVCEFVGYSKPELRLFAAYRSASVVYALRGIKHPDYEHRLGPRVDRILAELINANHGCLRRYYLTFPRDQRGYEEAMGEILRVYGMAQTQKIRFKRPIGDNYQTWLKDRIEISLGAFRLARAVITDVAAEDRVKRLTNSGRHRFAIKHSEWLENDLKKRIDALESILDSRE